MSEIDTIDALMWDGHAAPAKKRARRESDLQTTIIDFLNAQPDTHVWKAGAYAGRASYRDRRTGALHDRFIKIGRPGVSDIVGWRTVTIGGIRIAQFIALEVKRAGEHPKPHQQRFLDRAAAAGVVTGVVRSLADVKALL